MLNIFDYLDYRKFLYDFYCDKKKNNPGFSYQIFAEKAGFKSKSQIKLIIDGKRNVTSKSIEKLNKVLKLGKKAFSYFRDLVAFCQAKDNHLRNHYLLRLANYNKRNPARTILRNQYDFYSQWYHNTVRELTAHCGMGDDYEQISKTIDPRISPAQAQQSVAMLVKLGLLGIDDENNYIQTNKIITTGNEVKSVAVRNFHKKNMDLAAQSIDTFDRSERDISCLVVGLSDRGFMAFKKEIQNFRKRLLCIVEKDDTVNRIYHVNFQIFPTSRKVHKQKDMHD